MMNNEKTMIELAQEQGIYLRGYTEGDHRTTCPICSRNRKKPNDPCLSVTVKHDSIVWMCHHCEWSGGVREGKVERFINIYEQKVDNERRRSTRNRLSFKE